MAKKLFVNAKTEAGLDAAVAEGTLNAEVAFLEEQGNEGIHAKGKTYQTIPSNGRDGQVLMASNGKGVWADLDVTDMLSYGVEWKPNVADPILNRVGNMQLHKELPIQSGMRGCIYNPVEKKVVYWLDPEDWRFRASLNETKTISVDHTADWTFDNSLEDSESHIPENKTDRSIIQYHYFNREISGDNISFEYYVLIRQVNGATQKILYKNTINTGSGAQYYLIDVESTDITLQEALNLWIEAQGSVYPNSFNLTYYLPANLDGYDGEVMVYVPGFFIRSWDESDRREVRISTIKIDDTWEYQPPLFVGAYKDTVLNTVPYNMGYLSTLEANTAISIANSATYCRGGNNVATNDADGDIFKRQLGKCRTDISRATFRGYVRKAGKEIMSYRQYKNIMYWLYVIEYANFNSQAPYSAELTAEGFHQGGLGNGLTNVSNWESYNSYYPITPNGYTDEIGNGTGVKLIAPLGPAPVGSVYATRWRGIENPFGDTWNNVDGIIIDADADNHPNNMNYVYTTNDPTKYGDALADTANMVLSGLEVHANEYTKEWDLGTTAEIIPRLMGGNTTQYKCDYHWTGGKNTALRTLLLGGRADNGALAGLGAFDSGSGVAYSYATVSFRSVSVV